MPSTRSTLSDALAQARSAGLSGSPLERALRGFEGLEAGGTNRGDIRDIGSFRIPQPQFTIPGEEEEEGGGGGLLNTLLSGLQTVSSGEEFWNLVLPGDPGTAVRDQIERIPLVGNTLGTIADIAASPLTLLPAAAPARAIGLASKVPVVGKLGANALLEPILASPTFATRLATETGLGFAAESASSFALERLPEDSPLALQLAVGLGAGIATVGSAATGLRLLSKSNPTAVHLSAIEQLKKQEQMTLGMTDDPRFYEEGFISQMASLDNASREIRSHVMKGLATGDLDSSPSLMLGQAGPHQRVASDFFKAITDAKEAESEQVVDMLYSRIHTNVPEPIKAPWLTKYMPEKFNQWVVNGWIGREPIAREIATTTYGYMTHQREMATAAVTQFKSYSDQVYGPKLEKVTFRSTATGDLKTAWNEAQQTGNTAMQWALLVERRGEFNLSKTQQEFLDDYDYWVEHDLDVTRKVLGKDPIPPELEAPYYAPHAIEFVDVQKALQGVERVLDEGDILKAMGTEKRAFGIGGRKPFQYSRIFPTIMDAWKASKMNPDKLTKQLKGQLAEVRTLQTQRSAMGLNPRATANVQIMKRRRDTTVGIYTMTQNQLKEYEEDLIGFIKAVEEKKILPRVKNTAFEEMLSDRLRQSAQLRGETLALREASAYKDNPAILRDTTRVLEAANIGGLVKGINTASTTLRAAILSADFSTLGIQGWGAMVMGRGWKEGFEVFKNDFWATAVSEERFAKYVLGHADDLSYWALHDLGIAQNAIDVTKYSDDDLWEMRIFRGFGVPGSSKRLFDFRQEVPGTKSAMLPVKDRGKDINVVGKGIRALNRVQYQRMVMMWKLETAKHLSQLLKASADNPDIARELNGIRTSTKEQSLQFKSIKAMAGKGMKGMSEEAIDRQVADFVNSLFGGLNRVAGGRTAFQNIVESIFLLTPGFTRGALNIALKTGAGGASGALARDFAMRGTLLAGSLVYGFTVAANGIVDGELVKPNVTEPWKDNWMDIPLPNGQVIRPFSRFRSVAKLGVNGLAETVQNGPFAGVDRFTDDTLRWFSYRQSALLSATMGDPVGAVFGEQAGNRFARGYSIRDIISNPSTDIRADLDDLLASMTPITFQNIREAIQLNGVSPQSLRNAMIAVAAEGFGTSAFGPSLVERGISVRSADKAIEAGVPEDVVNEAVASSRPSWNARDKDGRYYLTTDERNRIVEEVAQEMGLDIEIVQKGGRITERERKQYVEGMRAQQVESFFTGMKEADEVYMNGDESNPGVVQLVEAFKDGRIDPATFGEMLGDLRLKKAAAKDAIERANPAALAFLMDPKLSDRRHERDLLFDAISTEAYAFNFFDAETMSFDFEAQEAHLGRLRAKYGSAYVAWEKRKNDRKHPVERERDEAMDRLSEYFNVADEQFMNFTGGVFGGSERELEIMLRKQVVEMGVEDPTQAALIIQMMKRSIPGVSQARQMTDRVRELMRMGNPQVESDVTRWLGIQPILP